jgi:four helix bundle protein
MGFKSVEEIHAFLLARAFKLEVYRLIRGSPEARADLRYKSQIQEALAGAQSNIREGYRRWHAGTFAHFLGFAGASLAEGLERLQDGIDREYFRAADCVKAQQLGDRASRATTALQTRERQLAEENRRKRKRQDQGPRTKGPGTNGPRTNGPGTNGPGTNGPGTNGPGTRDQQDQAPRTKDPGRRGSS